MAEYDKFGREIPDPTPVEIPTGVNRPLTLQEEMMRFIRSPAFHQEMQQQKGDQLETFAESDDFDVDDPEGFEDLPTAFEMTEEVVPRVPLDPLEPGDKDPPTGKPVVAPAGEPSGKPEGSPPGPAGGEVRT